MRGDEYSAANRRSPSGSDDEERQSPHWSLAPFGWQQRRQPAGAARRSEALRKEAAKARLSKHPDCEIQPADEPPLAQRFPRGGLGSPTRALCAAAGRRCRGGGLWILLLACALLAGLGWGYTRLHERLAAGKESDLARWRAAAAAAASQGTAAGQPPQQCRLQLDGSPWERWCQRLRRVCVDQGQLVFYDEEYQQLDGRKAGALPELLVDTSKLYEWPWRETSSEEGAGGGGGQRSLLYEVQTPTRTRRLVVPPLRPATSQEPTPYLQDPRFSTCTVPLLVYPSWRDNFFHIFKDLSAVYYALLRRTPWRQHAKLVVMTPDGLPLTQPEASLLPTLSQLSVQSLADFSRRLLPGYQPGQELDPSQPLPASFEGGEQRCFQDLFFCGRNIFQARGLPPAEEAAQAPAERQERLGREVPMEPYGFGQAVVAYRQQAALAQQKQQQRQGQQGQQQGPPIKDGIALQAEAGGLYAQLAARGRARTSGRLRILFMRRGGEGRQILNADELLQRCNAWRYMPPNATEPVTAECSEITVPNLEAGIAAAQEADVFIGMHGANLANAWMMRPGGSVIEIIPYQFETGRGSFVFSFSNSWDATSQVLWWVAVVCAPEASTPGPDELRGEGLPEWYPRDRNARVPWSVLESALRQAVAAGGSQQRYLEQYYQAERHKFLLTDGGSVQWGGRCPNGTAPGAR